MVSLRAVAGTHLTGQPMPVPVRATSFVSAWGTTAHNQKYPLALPWRDRIPVPLYYQLAQNMEEALESGELRSGDHLLSEKEIAENLRIAVGTVRRAWMYLKSRDVISHRSGEGTFIT
ncbi:winged helix-turn-helix domain-containing protein [Paenarthrobacter sp. NPDC089714]|uniref:winged helix-turn-helix domain-containing protein n=1 Tax=Paenarthrobacter sp. NPDC089714 TaxID=3364377 RepID=UPI0038258C57